MIEVVASGLLVVKHRSEPFGKFVNVAVLEGDQIKIVDEDAGAAIPDCPALVKSLLGFIELRLPSARSNVFVQLAASMRAHGRGGALLVVPAESHAWQDSIVWPMLYAVDPPFSELADHAGGCGAQAEAGMAGRSRRAVDAVAGLTAVDGATIINDRYDLLAFGAKITRRRGTPPVEQVVLTEPIDGSVPNAGGPGTARRHAPSVGRAVRLRPARRHRARGVAGRPLHDLQVVPLRGHGARAPGGRPAALTGSGRPRRTRVRRSSDPQRVPIQPGSCPARATAPSV